HELHARALDSMGRTDEAVSELRAIHKFAKSAKEEAALDILEAQLLWSSKRLTESVQACLSSIRHDPSNLNTRMFYVNVLAELGKRKDALKQLDAMTFKPGQADELRQRATLYDGLGEHAKASQDRDNAWKLSYQGRRPVSIHEQRGLMHLEQGDNGKALREFLLAIINESSRANKLELVERCWVVSQHQTFDAVRLSRAMVQQVIGQLVDLRKNGAKDKNITLLLVELYQSIGEKEKAIVEVSRLLSSDPDDPVLLEKRGLLYFNELFEFENAERDFTRAISMIHDKNVLRLYILRIRVRLAAGKKEGVMADLSKLIDESVIPPFKELSLRGYLYMTEGKIAEALADFDRSLSLRDTSFARGRRGELHLRLGNIDKSIIDLSRAIAINNRPANYYRLRAAANNRRGRYRESLDDLRVVLERSPRDPQALAMKSQIMRKL
ncbi:MAG: tetratricopeptide repeat protein, partial [Cyanobacteria bacterium]|nr:tetratricopeptide repeat protein [Cyanobacteriota bacterium]